MEDVELIAIVVVAVSVVLAAIATMFFLHWVDRVRIRGYFITRGYRLLEARWTVLWGLGEYGSRYYRVKFEDEDGDVHEALCRMNVLSRVYFTDDRIVRRMPRVEEQDEIAQLREENERLREEVERLKERKGRGFGD